MFVCQLIWFGGQRPLTEAGDIISLINTVRSQVREFQLSFDYLLHQILDRSTNDPKLNQTLDRLSIGASVEALSLKTVPSSLKD
ncbi:hypothetical protein IFO70_36795 [Phormidium tenue FACHB-886]|nr:hypothetical protein [Phormidium tenue FACHB-886]